MEEVGRIIEESTPRGFLFKASKDESIAEHDYVFVEMNQPKAHGKIGKIQVLAEIVALGCKNPLATEKLVAAESSEYSYKLVGAEVLGYLNEKGRIIRPTVAADPNSPVYRAGDNMLQNYFRGISDEIPLNLGRLLNRPEVKVPIHLQGLQFHLGVFAATRAGKSYLAGRFIEEILLTTPFPVLVFDIHADYVKMDQHIESHEKHGDFEVVVHHPPKVTKIEGLSAEWRELDVSPQQMTNEAIIELLGGSLGERQEIDLRKIIRQLRDRKEPFGLSDILARIREKLDDPKVKGKERDRYESLEARLEDLEEDVTLPPEGMNIEQFFKPHTLNIICLNGIRNRVQDAYVSIILDLLFRYVTKPENKRSRALFVFVEEAHRVASKTAGGTSYSVRTISTVMREGSKFGLFLTLISQRPRNIDPDILSNIGNYAVLRINNPADQQMIEDASESFSHRLVRDLPSLNQGEAVLVGPFVPLPAHVEVLERITTHFGVTPNLKNIISEINSNIKKAEKGKW
jgi:DNA helicase HerA-like ATPase